MWKIHSSQDWKTLEDMYINSLICIYTKNYLEGLDDGTLIKKESILRAMDNFKNTYIKSQWG
ncbi:MAG: hypothetical protein AABY07_02695 [Nanoarchaeota archaeon]